MVATMCAQKETEDEGRPEAVSPPPGFERSLSDAEILLRFAAESGRLSGGKQPQGAMHGDMITDGILDARAAVECGAISRHVLRRFWVAVSELSVITGSVSAASLAACAANPIRWLKLRVLSLACIVILGSIGLFMNNSTADEIMDLIGQQNATALKLWSDLQYFRTEDGPGDIHAHDGGISERRAFAGASQMLATTVPHLTTDELFGEIVEFSRKSNWLLETASRLNDWFNPPQLRVDVRPVVFQEGNPDHVTAINVPPDIKSTEDIVNEGLKQIVAYQLIRNFALASYKTNSVFYGGITTYLLPAVYALLGASLYGFRLTARLIRNRTYLPSAAHSARYFIALIAGIVIGLFSGLIPKGVSLPPLAVAFLVGYAVEAFFSRLDDMIDRFRQSAASARPAAIHAEALAPAE